jgi:hypothetical protein
MYAYCTEKASIWEAVTRSVVQEVLPFFIEPEGSSLCSQELSTETYSGLDVPSS